MEKNNIISVLEEDGTATIKLDDKIIPYVTEYNLSSNIDTTTLKITIDIPKSQVRFKADF